MLIFKAKLFYLKHVDITIIGAGNVGAEIFFLLLHHPEPMRINIIEPDEGRAGALLDISHVNGYAKHHSVFINENELIPEADYVYYTAGYCNEPHESRMAVTEKNVILTAGIFGKLKFNKSPYIIAVTNPVDLIAYVISEVTAIPPARILGTGTYLDTMRLNYYVALELIEDVSKISGWVLGEHGDSMVPVFSQTKVDGESIFEKTYLKKLDAIALNTVKAAAMIRKTQAGTWFGIAHCSYRVLQEIMNKTEKILPLSIQTDQYYKDLLEIDNQIYISLPAKLTEDGFIPHNQFKLNQAELEMLQKSAQTLAGNYNKIGKIINELVRV